MKDKYNRKIDADQIKKLVASKAASANYDIDVSSRIPRNKKARTGVLLYRI